MGRNWLQALRIGQCGCGMAAAGSLCVRWRSTIRRSSYWHGLQRGYGWPRAPIPLMLRPRRASGTLRPGNFWQSSQFERRVLHLPGIHLFPSWQLLLYRQARSVSGNWMARRDLTPLRCLKETSSRVRKKCLTKDEEKGGGKEMQKGPKPAELQLSEEERKGLGTLVHRYSTTQQLAKRGRIGGQSPGFHWLL